MSQTTDSDELSASTKDHIVTFAKIEGVDVDFRTADTLTDDLQSVHTLNLEDGMVVNPDNTVMLAFNDDDIPQEYRVNHSRIDEPLASVTIVEDEDLDACDEFALFETESQTKTGIQLPYLQTVEDVYGIDLLEDAAAGFSNGEQHGWPVRIDSPDGDSFIMIAPLALTYRNY